MTNKIKFEDYYAYLNPHAKTLVEEYKVAHDNKMWATAIILSLTIIDNILSDENCLEHIDGLDLNELKKDQTNFSETNWEISMCSLVYWPVEKMKIYHSLMKKPLKQIGRPNLLFLQNYLHKLALLIFLLRKHPCQIFLIHHDFKDWLLKYLILRQIF